MEWDGMGWDGWITRIVSVCLRVAMNLRAECEGLDGGRWEMYQRKAREDAWSGLNNDEEEEEGQWMKEGGLFLWRWFYGGSVVAEKSEVCWRVGGVRRRKVSMSLLIWRLASVLTNLVFARQCKVGWFFSMGRAVESCFPGTVVWDIREYNFFFCLVDFSNRS